MARFTTTRYPGLSLQDDKGIWAQFTDGACETADQSTIKRLRTLPDDYEVAEVKDAPAETPPK
ncbi:hypothetical protein [Kitasatospora sp. NPDC087314]|uniref:hypothetical protein n=1 Tax=Kitasatospora sp. NPDC087314 TaxID=3364068 RepID=UPI00382A51A5